MRIVVVAVLFGCGARAPVKPIANAPDRHVEVGFPCGAETIYELTPFEPAPCDANGVCSRGRSLRAVGACTVAPSSSFDLYGGRNRLTVLEGGLPILSSDPTPYARTVVFDPRLPHDGVHVGMTGADLEAVVPPYTEIECSSDDASWRGHLRCHLHKDSDPECDAVEASGLLVVFEPGDRLPDRAITGPAARLLVRARRILAIDLGPSCGED